MKATAFLIQIRIEILALLSDTRQMSTSIGLCSLIRKIRKMLPASYGQFEKNFGKAPRQLEHSFHKYLLSTYLCYL